MAKHIVKCLYCGKEFDLNDSTTEWVKPNGRRYAHKKCYEEYQASLSKEERDKEALYQYIKKTLGKTMDYTKVKRQIKQYRDENNYTYSGMLSTLKYVFEVKGNSIEAAHGGIGIIPYAYKQAYDYYYAIYLAQQKTQQKKMTSKVEKITIESPRMWVAPPKLWFEEDKE